MENLTESKIKRKIDTLKQALEDKNVPEVAHPKMKEDLKKFEKMLKDFEKKVEKEAEKDIKKVDDIADLDLPDLDLGEDKPKKPAKKRGRPKKKTYEVTVDGKKFSFTDKSSADNCQKAIALVKAQKDQQKESTKKYEAKSTSAKISNNLQTIAKQAVAKAKSRNVAPATLKKQVDAVEKAFKTLFNALETLMGAKISQAQRNAIMRILNDFEDKKTKTTRITKKEMGGKVDNWEDVDPDVLYAKGGEITFKKTNDRTQDGNYWYGVYEDGKPVMLKGEHLSYNANDIEHAKRMHEQSKRLSSTYAEGGGVGTDTTSNITWDDVNDWVHRNKNGSKKHPEYNATHFEIMTDISDIDSREDIEEDLEWYKSKWKQRYNLASTDDKTLEKQAENLFYYMQTEARKGGVTYAEGGEVQEPKNSWDWQSFL